MNRKLCIRLPMQHSHQVFARILVSLLRFAVPVAPAELAALASCLQDLQRTLPSSGRLHPMISKLQQQQQQQHRQETPSGAGDQLD